MARDFFDDTPLINNYAPDGIEEYIAPVDYSGVQRDLGARAADTAAASVDLEVAEGAVSSPEEPRTIDEQQ